MVCVGIDLHREFPHVGARSYSRLLIPCGQLPAIGSSEGVRLPV
jgi:hypothetical protein